MKRCNGWRCGAAALLAAGVWCGNAQAQYYTAPLQKYDGDLRFWTFFAPEKVLVPGHMNDGVNEIVDKAQGKTPLMLDAEEGNIEAVLYLLERGVDTMARDDAGETALDLARKAGAARIIQILELDRELHPAPEEYYSGRTAQIHITGGDRQKAPSSRVLRRSLKVLVTDDTGKPLRNAPVRFSTDADGGNLITSAMGPGDKVLILRTDQSGVCSAYYVLPDTGSWSAVKASVGAPGREAGVTFYEEAGETNFYTNPFAISVCIGNPDGSQQNFTYTWTRGSREESCVKVITTFPNGDQRVVRTLLPDQTSTIVNDGEWSSVW